jgi:hypothetical protein
VQDAAAEEPPPPPPDEHPVRTTADAAIKPTDARILDFMCCYLSR